MEGRLLGQLRLGVGGHAVGHGHREAVLGGIHAHVDIGALPCVGGVDVVRAGGRGADEVVGGPQQHVVAGARPRLVGEQDHVRVEARVVEEVERVPAAPRGDRVGLEHAVEVVGAVDVPEVAGVLVVLRRAGEPERVVAADGVAHDLDQRVLVDVVELPVQAGHRVRVAHDRARGGGVEPALEAALELAGVEGEEVRALTALHVEHLDVLALAHLVGERGGAVDAEVQPRLGQRRRQLDLDERPRRRPPHLDDEVRGRRVSVDDPARRRADLQRGLALGQERLRGAGRRVGPEQPQAARDAERARVLAPVGRQDRQLRRLAAVRVAHRHAVVAVQAHHGRAAGADPPQLPGRIGRLEPGDLQRLDGHAYALAGAFASSSAACAISCSARSRLPAASSFLTSFSTARRL